MNKEIIGFIGLGNMAQAIIAGLRKSEQFADARIIGYDRNESKRETMSTAYQVEIASNIGEVSLAAQVLILAIKPAGLEELLLDLEPILSNGTLLVSLAAGKPLDFLDKLTGNRFAIARAIPNINAKAGASMTAICYNQRISKEQAETLVAIFDAIGSVTELPEDKVPAFSAISGAGPAFAYAFIDALATAGIRAGLPRALAQKAACAMLFGSAKLAAESLEHPRALIDQVTSPGGTTIEGMHKLTALGFEHAVHEAVAAVIEKESKLSK